MSANEHDLRQPPGSPLHVCPFCHGKREYNGHDCEWCDGLGARFSDVIFRGHPAYEGRATVIEGCCPVRLTIERDGELLVFEKACEPAPPYWFVKEDGKQVYRYVANRKAEARGDE